MSLYVVEYLSDGVWGPNGWTHTAVVAGCFSRREEAEEAAARQRRYSVFPHRVVEYHRTEPSPPDPKE